MGSTLDIRILPDSVLRAVCAPVAQFDAGLATLAQQMLDTMYAAPGRGLAAPQVGITQRIFVMDATWKEGRPAPMVFVNPVITARSETLVVGEEGCLSIPGQTSMVARPDRVSLRWQDASGVAHTDEFEGFAATCIQHEADHLDGILCIDREDS